MFGKFLIIALVCVSAAQVYGDELQIAKDKAVRRVNALNVNARDRYNELITTGDYNKRHIDYWSYLIIERARKVQESSKQTIRKVAAVVEEKARENNRPQSVFQCIKTSEERANSEIQTLTAEFKSDIDRLSDNAQYRLQVASRPCHILQPNVEVNYSRTIETIQNCPDIRCINNAVGSFAGQLNNYHDALGECQGQIIATVSIFETESQDHYTNSNRQVNRVRSAALRAVKACYSRGEREVFGVQDSDEVQQF